MSVALLPAPPPWRRLVEARPPVRLGDLLDAWAEVLERPDRPDLDTVAAITVDTHGSGSVTVHVDEHDDFLRWAAWLGLAFVRVFRAGGFVLAARGPVKAGAGRLLVHVSCIPFSGGIPA